MLHRFNDLKGIQPSKFSIRYQRGGVLTVALRPFRSNRYSDVTDVSPCKVKSEIDVKSSMKTKSILEQYQLSHHEGILTKSSVRYGSRR